MLKLGEELYLVRSRSFVLAVFAKSLAWCAAVACTTLLSSVACAQGSGTRVTGSLTNASGATFLVVCTGEPTCVGNVTVPVAGCSNSDTVTNGITITGLNLAQAGSIQGNVSGPHGGISASPNGDGTCTFNNSGLVITTDSYTGTWDGNAGQITTGSGTHGAFTAVRSSTPQVFPMTVTGGIANGVANFQAQIQFRSQDVGTAGSVYVFALAPANLVSGLVEKDGPCVLAQLNSSGQLQGVTDSSLHPYMTGVLSAQGQAVTLLNNVPTANVAGATIYVGYGASSSAMIANGIYQGAVSVPGTAACPLSAVSYEGLWLKSDESGWGLNLTQQGTILFGTWFTYDSDGSGLWLVMSNGAQTSPGNFSGTLYRTTGPAFNSAPFTPIVFPTNYSQVGTLTLSFTDANTGTMSYTVNGVTQSKAITRYIYASGGTNCTLLGTQGASPNYQDLWLKADEAGWGVNLTHQGDILFATWFTYQAGGKGQWLVMSNGTKTAPGVYTGGLQRTTGPAFSAVPFNPNSVTRTTVGSATFTFSDVNNATFAYTVDGVSQSKRITRYVYSSPTTVCQ